MKSIRMFAIIAGSVLLFSFASCKSDDTPVTQTQTKQNEPDPNNFFGLIDYDQKHTDGSYSESDYARNGKTYTFTAKEVSGGGLQQKVNALASGDTLILDGSDGMFNLTTIRVRQSNITIKGVNNAVLDFSATYGEYTQAKIDEAVAKVKEGASAGGSHYLSAYDQTMYEALQKGRGFYIDGNYNIFEDMVIQNASDNGLLLISSSTTKPGGNYNIIRNVEARFCGDSGFQLSGRSVEPIDCPEEYSEIGPMYNKFFNCYSHDNYDSWNLGENADGFAVKGGPNDFNYFENCVAEYNSDDGWDCFRIRGSATWVNCKANYNGIRSSTKEVWGDCSNGNGFKVGGGAKDGVLNGQVVNSPEKHPHAQYLKGCSAVGNRGNSGVGFDRNNQYGSLYLVDCYATDNHANIYIGSKTTLRHEDYAFGSYGNTCYALRCYIGASTDVVGGKYKGDKITVK